jgi:hypothetical protein
MRARGRPRVGPQHQTDDDDGEAHDRRLGTHLLARTASSSLPTLGRCTVDRPWRTSSMTTRPASFVAQHLHTFSDASGRGTPSASRFGSVPNPAARGRRGVDGASGGNTMLCSASPMEHAEHEIIFARPVRTRLSSQPRHRRSTYGRNRSLLVDHARATWTVASAWIHRWGGWLRAGHPRRVAPAGTMTASDVVVAAGPGGTFGEGSQPWNQPCPGDLRRGVLDR